MNNEIDKITYELFKWGYFNDSIYTDEVDDKCKDIAVEQIQKYGWENVWKSWYLYLINNCKTVKDVCSFANLFYAYDGPSYPINNPYEFLGYIYYYLELCSSKYEEEYNALTIMDGVTMDVLENSGIRKDLWLDTSYVPEKDQNIIDSVTEWKKKEEK